MAKVNQETKTSSSETVPEDGIILDLEELDLKDLKTLKGTALGNILENTDPGATCGHRAHTSHSSHSKHGSGW